MLPSQYSEDYVIGEAPARGLSVGSVLLRPPSVKDSVPQPSPVCHFGDCLSC